MKVRFTFAPKLYLFLDLKSTRYAHTYAQILRIRVRARDLF